MKIEQSQHKQDSLPTSSIIVIQPNTLTQKQAYIIMVTVSIIQHLCVGLTATQSRKMVASICMRSVRMME